MTKHTPGPWVSFTTEQGGPGVSIDETSDFWSPILEEGDQEAWVICRLTKWDRCDKDPKVVAANMALIAAAPDLLAALEQINTVAGKRFDGVTFGPDPYLSSQWKAVYTLAHEAIAKAGGAK